MKQLILISILSLGFVPVSGQHIAGKLGLEITKAKIGVHAGPYRGRTPETSGPFDQGFALMSQVYFPFQFAADYRKNFSDSASITNEYNNRVFLIRPSALFHFVDNGSIAMGGGIQFSFLIGQEFYLEYQTSGVYLEATDDAGPDFNDGFNLHHFISISKPIARHFTLSLGLIHMSGAGLGANTSNQDVISFGVKWNL